MRINTPCIGICSTVYGDEVCRGCKRRFKEIIDWNNLDLNYQDQIWARLNKQAEQVLNKNIKIINFFMRSLLEITSKFYCFPLLFQYPFHRQFL